MDTNPPHIPTSAPLAALALPSGQHFGETATVFSYPALVHREGKTLLAASEIQGWERCGERWRKEKVGTLPYSPQPGVNVFDLESTAVTKKKKSRYSFYTIKCTDLKYSD